MRTLFLFLFLVTTRSVMSQDINTRIERTIKEIYRDIDEQKNEEALEKSFIADSLFVEADETDSYEYAFLKRTIGYLYSEKGDDSKAEKYYEEAVELFRENCEPDDPYYIITINEYSMILCDEERYSEAEPLILEAMENQSAKRSSKTPEYAYTLANLGALYYAMDRYSEAEAILKEAVEIRRGRIGDYRKDYAISLDILASIYQETERYDLAIDLYNETLTQYKKSFGDKSSEYTYTLSLLGDVYVYVSQYRTAEPLYRQALEIERSKRGEKTEDYTIYLTNLGIVYSQLDEYEKAEMFYKEALDIELAEDFYTSDTYHGLSQLYLLMADYASAEDMIRMTISSEDLANKNNYNYLVFLNQMGNIYTLTGQYEKAKKAYIEVIEKGVIIYGEKSSSHAIDIDNLANLYRKTGETELARPLIIQAMEIKENNLGEMSLDVAYSLETLSSISLQERKFSEAEDYRKQAIEIYRQRLGTDHTDYAHSLNGLALIYLDEEKYPEAESLFKIAEGIFKKRVGENHPSYFYTLMNLAELYEYTERPDSAELLYLEVNQKLHNEVVRNLRYMAEREKEDFIASITDDFSQFNAFVYRRIATNPSLAGVVYDNQLALKGVVLQSTRALRQAVINSGDNAGVELYEKMNTTKSLLLEHEKLPMEQRWLNVDSLENVSVNQEREVNKKIKTMPGTKDSYGIDIIYRWKEVQNSLGENEAAIEFVSFDGSTHSDTIENIIYCALVLRPGMKHPEMVFLFDEEELNYFMYNNKTPSHAATADKLYSFISQNSNGEVFRNLYEIIWKPVEEYLENIESVYYSPVGLLNVISFDAIPCDGSTYLSDRYKMIAVTSTREVIEKQNEFLQPDKDLTTVFYGGIDYDADTTMMKSKPILNGSMALSRSRFLVTDTSRGEGFTYLEGTLSEVNEISSVLGNKKIQALVLTGDEATEGSFKSLNNLNSPVCLHIATHGFFFPEPEVSLNTPGSRSSDGSNIYRSSDNPLFRSGLIFAGGNHTWKNQALPPDVEDGILLASEVAEMYLPNTRLVVLSACETGLGEIKGTEGVFGLQRSFKMAGVDYLIISLWQVPDYQTSELMTGFYENWLSGQSIHDSFRNAQIFMKQKYKNSPSAWAAFVLMN